MIILRMYGMSYLLMISYSASGRVSGFLSNKFAIICFINGDTDEGRGVGSLSLINFIVS
jgi:hypothetical protein